ncbi:MAG TPA: AAA family ATPase [Acidimicrobiales bacterium]
MSSPLSSPVFVGRDDELARLIEAWDGAAGGRPATVLVGGEAGVGKSRLLAELAAHVADGGGRWMIGGCASQGGASLPFAPVVAALRGFLRTTPEAEVDRLVGPARAELARLLPELGAAGHDPLMVDLFTTSPGRLFEVVLSVLHRIAGEQPLALVLEDLHWADPSTLALVEFVARNLGDEALLLVASYRTDELHRGHPLRPALAEIQRIRTVTSLVLEPFSPAEVAEQLAAILGEPPPADVVDRIAERSNGVAFFVEELAASIGEFDAVPQGLQELLRTRIDALDPATQEIVHAVAAGTVGGPVPDRVVAAVTGRSPAELAGPLREALSSHVLVVADDGYAFRHALMREVVEQDLLPGERTALHSAYARAFVADDERAGEDPATAGRVALHFLASHDLVLAARWSWKAGKAADRAYAFAEAAAHYQRVLELWDRIDDPASTVGAERIAVATAAAQAVMHGGNAARALALARSELARDDAPGSDGDERRGTLVSLLALALRQVGRLSECIDVLAAALAAFPDEVSQARTLLKCELALSLALQQRTEAAQAAADDAVADAHRVGDPALIGRALNPAALVALRRGDGEAAVALLTEGFELSRRAGDLDATCRAYVNLSDTLRQLGRYEASAEFAAEGVRYTAEHRLRLSTGVFIEGNQAEALVPLGRLDEVFDLVPPRSEIAHNADAHRTVVRAWALLRAGRTEGVARMLDEVEPTVRGMPDITYRGALWRNRAELAWLTGDHEAGLAAAAGGVADEEKEGATQYTAELCALGLRCIAELLADPLAAIDEADRAAAMGRARELAARAAELATEPAGSMPPPLSAALAAAELARIGGDADERIGAWGEVVRQAEAWSDPWHESYAAWRTAEVLCDAGRLGEAAPWAARAHRVAVAIGAQALRRHVEALARRARLDLGAAGDGDQAPAAGAARATVASAGGQAAPGEQPEGGRELARLGLTPREIDVLTLVAEGRTNRQIAAELYISAKTASVHVSNILAKLGVRTRTQAAAVAHRVLGTG